jgi:hypothetical protein
LASLGLFFIRFSLGFRLRLSLGPGVRFSLGLGPGVRFSLGLRLASREGVGLRLLLGLAGGFSSSLAFLLLFRLGLLELATRGSLGLLARTTGGGLRFLALLPTGLGGLLGLGLGLLVDFGLGLLVDLGLGLTVDLGLGLMVDLGLDVARGDTRSGCRGSACGCDKFLERRTRWPWCGLRRGIGLGDEVASRQDITCGERRVFW